MVFKVFVFILFLAVTVHTKQIFWRHATFSADDVLNEEWKTYKLQHGREYADRNEDMERFRIFMENKMFVAEHNQLYERGQVTYSVEMNEYGDMTDEEFEKNMFGDHEMNSELDMDESEEFYTPPKYVKVPRSVDWREQGAVTTVKSQKKCGSCWAFSAAAALEAQHFIKTGFLVDLSEQNLVDCSGKFGNHGCNGGTAKKAFKYVSNNGGIDTYRSYPYEAENGTCRYKAKNSVTTAKGYKNVEPTEYALRDAVALVGPISVSINAKGKGFRFYKNGVYDNPNCSKKKLGHAVVVVGYGAVETGDKYWLVKNSWGRDWGLRGFGMMARFRDNQCGIARRPSFPIV